MMVRIILEAKGKGRVYDFSKGTVCWLPQSKEVGMASAYEELKEALENIEHDLETERFVPEAKWLHLEREIENRTLGGGISGEESLDLKELLDELRLEHDLRMNPGTLGS